MTKIIKVENLNCPNCSAKIEKTVAQLVGVNSVKVDFATKLMTLDLDDAKLDSVLPIIKSICLRVEPKCVLTIQ